MTSKYNANYEVFHRTMWVHNPRWPNGLEPGWGERHHVGYAETIDEAREMCQEYNDEHDPGELGDKAEFSSDFRRNTNVYKKTVHGA